MRNTFIIALSLIALAGAGCNLQRLKINPTSPSSTVQTSTTTQTFPQGQITIFVGDGCPHCAIVESRVKNGRVDQKLPIVFKEVFNDQNNAAQMIQIAKGCGLPLDNLGVPLLWDGKQCYDGDEPILKYIDDRMQKYANEPK